MEQNAGIFKTYKDDRDAYVRSKTKIFYLNCYIGKVFIAAVISYMAVLVISFKVQAPNSDASFWIAILASSTVYAGPMLTLWALANRKARSPQWQKKCLEAIVSDAEKQENLLTRSIGEVRQETDKKIQTISKSIVAKREEIEKAKEYLAQLT